MYRFLKVKATVSWTEVLERGELGGEERAGSPPTKTAAHAPAPSPPSCHGTRSPAPPVSLYLIPVPGTGEPQSLVSVSGTLCPPPVSCWVPRLKMNPDEMQGERINIISPLLLCKPSKSEAGVLVTTGLGAWTQQGETTVSCGCACTGPRICDPWVFTTPGASVSASPSSRRGDRASGDQGLAQLL